jgi:hypothetical protein
MVVELLSVDVSHRLPAVQTLLFHPARNGWRLIYALSKQASRPRHFIMIHDTPKQPQVLQREWHATKTEDCFRKSGMRSRLEKAASLSYSV